MSEVFVEFADPVRAPSGKTYIAQACGGQMADGMWQGWIEFIPVGDGEPIRSGRETTQPNRQDTEYWATGLTPVYLEGSLSRALKEPFRRLVHAAARPVFEGPREPIVNATPPAESVLDPFSVYRKGEALLRRQLSALAGWHLVNIIRDYRLSSEDPALLSAREPAWLVEMIVDAVRGPRAVRP